jgi:nucleotide-binding universal stress UspA family protein
MDNTSARDALLALDWANPPVQVEAILVPLDGSEFAERALTVADHFAAALGASVSTVSVCDSELGRQQMVEYYERLVQRTGRIGLGWTLPIENAEPGACIVETALTLADSLICMASHGRGRLSTAVLGSVARSVLRESLRPTMVVGPHCSIRSDSQLASESGSALPVVACIDGSPATATVLRAAIAWAQSLQTALDIVTVAEPAPPTIRDEQRYRRAHGPEVDATAYVNDIAATLRAATGLVVSAHAIYNPLSAAAGVEEFLARTPSRLLVVATHGRIGAAQLMLGSQAAQIVHDSSVPVLVAPFDIDVRSREISRMPSNAGDG